MTAETRIAYEVLAEVGRQVERWGEQNHPDFSRYDHAPSARREYSDRADRWKTANEGRAKFGNTAWDGVLLEEVYEALAEEDPARIRAELVQVAAVAMNWIGAIDRREVQSLPDSEQQPPPGPGCYPPADGWDGVSITEEAAVDHAHAFLGGPSLTTDAELRALTPDQLEKCVHRALEARDVQAVEGYLLLMALKDPGRAQLLMDTMKVGLHLAKEHRP